MTQRWTEPTTPFTATCRFHDPDSADDDVEYEIFEHTDEHSLFPGHLVGQYSPAAGGRIGYFTPEEVIRDLLPGQVSDRGRIVRCYGPTIGVRLGLMQGPLEFWHQSRHFILDVVDCGYEEITDGKWLSLTYGTGLIAVALGHWRTIAEAVEAADEWAHKQHKYARIVERTKAVREDLLERAYTVCDDEDDF